MDHFTKRHAAVDPEIYSALEAETAASARASN
jgi:hypothetical protein